MLHKGKYHITYCTNIHPGRNWEETFSNLKTYVPAIKKNISEDAFGLGLRLSNKASEELNEGERLADFKKWLDENNLYVFTMNGFPYGNFHKERVKENVHKPDWTTRERLDYTSRLFKQLSYLIPSGVEGGISTSPIGYKHWYVSDEERQHAFQKAAEHFCSIAEQLREIEQTSDTYLHLDIEPEPDGLLENGPEVVQFYKEYLLPYAEVKLARKLGATPNKAVQTVLRHITVCYDICHFSLAYELPKETFERFKEAGIKVGKIQVSAALKMLFTENHPEQIWNAIAKFDEPTYLHQVTERTGNRVRTYSDLPEVLNKRNSYEELRAHFHVPVFLKSFDVLQSTQDQILAVLDYLQKHEVSRHLEVETYTWDVLPSSLKLDLAESITREIKWLIAKV